MKADSILGELTAYSRLSKTIPPLTELRTPPTSTNSLPSYKIPHFMIDNRRIVISIPKKKKSIKFVHGLDGSRIINSNSSRFPLSS